MIRRTDASPLLAGVLALALAAAGCGGGSSSDILSPRGVGVSLQPLETVGLPAVALELAAVSGSELALELSGSGLEGAAGVVFELRYDPALLEFTGVGPGTFFGDGSRIGAEVTETEPGVLVGVAAGSDPGEGRNGSGALLTLGFRLRQLRDAETTLVFGAEESAVYGTETIQGQHAFIGARLVTRIRTTP
ncbi:MAG TPA: cohesin domain-containing protein [Gemmatimonadota bacterium]|jgi:hypothetical protein